MKPTRIVAGNKPGRGSATDDAYDQIKRRILTCELAPGVELREIPLAQSTGFGRSPVREALRRLVQEGFVEVRPRQGYRVSVVTLNTVHEVFELRLMLEPPAVELAARRAPKKVLLGLGELAHARYRHADADSYERFIVDNREFHVGIAEATGNHRLARVLRTLLEEMQRLFYLSLGMDDTAREQMREHHALYDALLEGDASRARAIAVEQIEESRQRVVQALVARFVDGRDLAVAVTDGERGLEVPGPRRTPPRRLVRSRPVLLRANEMGRRPVARGRGYL